MRQGDPLFPMLFVLVMEVLNALIREVEVRCLFRKLNQQAIRSRASFYADDLVIFLSPWEQDFNLIKAILQ